VVSPSLRFATVNHKNPTVIWDSPRPASNNFESFARFRYEWLATFRSPGGNGVLPTFPFGPDLCSSSSHCPDFLSPPGFEPPAISKHSPRASRHSGRMIWPRDSVMSRAATVPKESCLRPLPISFPRSSFWAVAGFSDGGAYPHPLDAPGHVPNFGQRFRTFPPWPPPPKSPPALRALNARTKTPPPV